MHSEPTFKWYCLIAENSSQALCSILCNLWNNTLQLQEFLRERESLFPLVQITVNFDSLMLYSNMLYFGNFKAGYGMCCRGEGRRVGRTNRYGPFLHIIPTVIHSRESYLVRMCVFTPVSN